MVAHDRMSTLNLYNMIKRMSAMDIVYLMRSTYFPLLPNGTSTFVRGNYSAGGSRGLASPTFLTSPPETVQEKSDLNSYMSVM